ncbi:MAG: hypothetical protein HYZ62_02110, partial [Candidatus Andersenbacteria bacterium]|nr:hypothetical protein [Candidatus Andersenbacteria bacterium]
YSGTAVASTLAAGIISLSIASINILPLREFLPQTERNQTLPPEEYFEFSYPPHHAITLLLPYFYGNHESYWGAKGFQELAAYVGFAPLILAATAAVNWKSHKSIRLSALTLIGLAAIMATGKYSPVYTALVNHNLLPPLSVPGRFVFFFDVGIALLASAGLSDVLRGELSLKKNRLLATLSIAAAGITAFAPFFMSLANDGRSFEQFMSLFGTNSWQLIPLLIGALAIPLIIIHIHSQAPNKKPIQIAVLGTAVLPLLLYSWNYNPRMPATLARVENKFAKQISDYSRSHPVPARLYSHERLLQTTPVNKNIRRTDTISPGFWVIQPLLATKDNLECVLVDLNIRDARQGDLQVSIHKNLNDAPVRALSVNTGNLSSSKPNPLCFEPILQSANQTFYIRITSFIPTGVELTYKKLVDSPLQAHFVRVPVPTPDQISRSKKTAQLNIEPKYTTLIDREAAMLARHLQVAANASGARWIGALSIRPYREFIEKFFANDGEIIDGDGKHAIERNRTILNMAGITHLIQFLPPEATDTMPEAGFNLEDSYNTGEKEVRLYTNPAAWPKAFLVPQAQFIPAADEIRYAMSLPSFDAKQTVFLSGEIPPVIPALQPDPAIFAGTATITNYKDTRVDITTESTTDSYLVVTDSSSQQWQTFIDGRQASHLVAYSFFKAAQVPAGTHNVSFRYYSPAVAKAKIAASLGLASLLAMTILGAYNFKKNTPT